MSEYKAREASATAKRETKALELRAEGRGFDEIARELGYANRGSAWKAYKRALDATGPVGRTMTDEEQRQLELHRLDLLLKAVWPAASRGDLGAVREAKRLHDARVRLLGLSIAAGRTTRGFSDDEGDGDTEGTVVGPDRLDALRERRAHDAAERSART